MDYKITNDQKELCSDIIHFCQDKLNTEDTLEVFSISQWRDISEYGLLGLTVAEQYGGLELSYLTAAMAIEAMGYSCKNNGLVFAVNNHLWVAQQIIQLFGSDNVKNKYLPDMVNGKKIGAFALSEADAGSDAYNMSTTVIETEDSYILNGNKAFISNGPIGDVFVVIAVTRHLPRKELSAFIVEKECIGFSKGPEIQKMGLGACPMCELIFQDCAIPKENLLGKLNQGSFILSTALELERIFEFAPHIGAMKRVIEKCVEHVNNRKQFQKKLSEYQALTHKIADMHVAVEMARQYLYKVAWLKDQRKNAFAEASTLKLFVSERYIETCKDAMQIFGGYGYSKEYGIERELRDAMACSVYSGTSEIQRNTIFSFLANK